MHFCYCVNYEIIIFFVAFHNNFYLQNWETVVPIFIVNCDWKNLNLFILLSKGQITEINELVGLSVPPFQFPCESSLVDPFLCEAGSNFNIASRFSACTSSLAKLQIQHSMPFIVSSMGMMTKSIILNFVQPTVGIMKRAGWVFQLSESWEEKLQNLSFRNLDQQ